MKENFIGRFPATRRFVRRRLDEIQKDSDNRFDYIIDLLNKQTETINRLNQKIEEYEKVIERQEEKEKTLLDILDYTKSIKDETSRITCKQVANNRGNTNVSLQMWELAGKTTAEYVINNLSTSNRYATPEELRRFAINEIRASGLVMEFGVYSGNSINQIADLLTDNRIYGFDSFEGLPEDWRTGFNRGAFSVKQLPAVRGNVELIEGLFENTLPEFLTKHNEKVSFIHIDCDLYSSTKCVFDLLGARIQKDTIIVFDEYFNYPTWQNHEYRAFQEFVNEYKIEYEYIGYVPTYEQVAIRIK